MKVINHGYTNYLAYARLLNNELRVKVSDDTEVTFKVAKGGTTASLEGKELELQNNLRNINDIKTLTAFLQNSALRLSKNRDAITAHGRLCGGNDDSLSDIIKKIAKIIQDHTGFPIHKAMDMVDKINSIIKLYKNDGDWLQAVSDLLKVCGIDNEKIREKIKSLAKDHLRWLWNTRSVEVFRACAGRTTGLSVSVVDVCTVRASEVSFDIGNACGGRADGISYNVGNACAGRAEGASYNVVNACSGRAVGVSASMYEACAGRATGTGVGLASACAAVVCGVRIQAAGIGYGAGFGVCPANLCAKLGVPGIDGTSCNIF